MDRQNRRRRLSSFSLSFSLSDVFLLSALLLIRNKFKNAICLEPADLQFDRSYHALAWIAAADLEGLFALIIYGGAFKRVEHLNLRDIA